MPEKLMPGTPEHKAYMRSLGRKGGQATNTKHPGHLAEIAASGGRATAKVKPEPRAPRTPRILVTAPGSNISALSALDDILAELG